MGIYEELGIRRVINGNATLTRLGGSIMPQEVLDAMADASRSFVDIRELQRRVGDELALLAHNEAAYGSCGDTAALTLTAAACSAGGAPAAAFQQQGQFWNPVLQQQQARQTPLLVPAPLRA